MNSIESIPPDLGVQLLDVDEMLLRADEGIALPRLWQYSGQLHGQQHIYDQFCSKWVQERKLRPRDRVLLENTQIPADNPTLSRILKRFISEYTIGVPTREMNATINAEHAWIRLSSSVRSKTHPFIGPESFKQAILSESDDSMRGVLFMEKHKQSKAFAEASLDLRTARNSLARASGYENYYRMLLKQRFEITVDEADVILQRLQDACAPWVSAIENRMQQASSRSTFTSYDHAYYRNKSIASEFPNLQEISYQSVLESISQLFRRLGFSEQFRRVYIDSESREGKGIPGCIPVEPLPGSSIEAYVLFDETRMTIENITDIIHELFHGIHSASMNKNLLYIQRKPLPEDAVWSEMPGMLSAEFVPDILSGCATSIDLDRFIFANQLAQMARKVASILTLRLQQFVYESPNSTIDDINAYYRSIQKMLYPHMDSQVDGVYEWASDIYLWKYPLHTFGHIIADDVAIRIVQYGEKRFGSIRTVQYGKWLKTKLFSPGYSIDWRTLLAQSTGQHFSPETSFDLEKLPWDIGVIG